MGSGTCHSSYKLDDGTRVDLRLKIAQKPYNIRVFGPKSLNI